MNILKREWKSYQKQLIYWSIGLLALIIVAFYKVGGLNSVPGGIEDVLASLPPLLRNFFGASNDYTSATGIYRMIHLYLIIAIALHATLLGASIFAKEELDKTCEFLYVKEIKRTKILALKVSAGLSMLLFIDIVCSVGVVLSLIAMKMALDVMALLPYLFSIVLVQVFFFAITLLLSVALKYNRKAGSIGCGIVFVMLFINLYAKMGGNIELLDALSIFHYVDASFIDSCPYGGISSIIILFLSMLCFLIASYLHEHRDLL
ncbi:MAG: ABC transporter permease subunit [Longicatena sp.]